jgi:hypothetical protein
MAPQEEYLDPKPPFVWPDTRELEGVRFYEKPPLLPLLQQARQFFGIAYDVDEGGVKWLREALQQTREEAPHDGGQAQAPLLGCKIIIGVYAACRTREDDLWALHELQEDCKGQVEFRLLPATLWGGPPSNALYVVSEQYPRGLMMIGASPNFGQSELLLGHVNFVFQPDTTLMHGWQNWFDLTWSKAAPVTPSTLRIPPLVPATGSPEAAAMWREYVRQLSHQQHAVEQQEVVQVDPETGVVKVTDGAGVKKPTATEALDIPVPDPLAERISRLYERGDAATINKRERIPPFTMPIKAEWFGVEGHEKIGSISRKTTFTVSAFSSSDAAALDNQRSKVSDLLRQLSYPLSEGTRWVPTGVWPLLEEELERLNDKGRELLQRSLKGDPKGFLNGQYKRIEDGVKATYHDLHPDQPLPSDTMDLIMVALEERLLKLGKGQFLPTIAPGRFTWIPTAGGGGKPASGEAHSRWADSWAQAASFLYEIARYPRKATKDGRYFLRGYELDPDRVLEAMDICDDHFWKVPAAERDYKFAGEELKRLQRLHETVDDSKLLCQLLLDYMKGKPWNDIAGTAGLDPAYDAGAHEHSS